MLLQSYLQHIPSNPKPTITLAHDDLVLLYLQQSAMSPLLKDGRATLGSYRSCSCNSCVLSWNSDVSRYTSLGVLMGAERVIIHHAQTDLKLERTGKQDASRDQKELATEVTSKKLCKCVWLVTWKAGCV